MKLSNILILGALLVPITLRAANSPTRPPNVIFVLADDQRYDSLGITGHPVTQTPNLDRLADEGVFFKQAFVTSPICGPSRANFFTGQWERKNRIGFDYVSHNFISEETYADSWMMKLKEAGYSTAFIGKHHVKIADRGNTPFKQSLDFSYFKEGHLGFHLDKHKVFSNLKHKTQVEGLFEATEAYLKQGDSTDYFFENADPSIKANLKRRDPSKPFCAWINFNLPHAASIGGMGSQPTDPPFYSSLYAEKGDQFKLPESYPAKIPMPEEVFAASDLMPYYQTKNQKSLLGTKMKMSRAVHAIDSFIGELRKLIKEIGEEDNTIIVFCSDNGLLLGEHGLGGKTFLHEESVHDPLIIYAPALKSLHGTQIEELVIGQDVPATILQLCGLETPSSYQGTSLLPLMKGEEVKWREEVFLENLFTDQGYPRMEAVRGKQFKYIRYFGKDSDRVKYLPENSIEGEQAIYEELFDLSQDPSEQRNLAGNPEYASALKRYRARCQEMVTDLAK